MDEYKILYKNQTILTAFEKKDLQLFRRSLNSPDDVGNHLTESSVSIFERACLQPNSDSFIKECLAIELDVNKEHPHYNKCPIHFAVESFSYSNLKTLVENPFVNIDKKFASNTPINFLCQNIKDGDSFDELFRCIKLLISHHANLYIGNEQGITPIWNILRNENLNESNKKTIVEYILDQDIELDIDVGSKVEVQSLLKKLWPERQLPPVQSNEETWNFDKLVQCLRNKNESKFLHGINAFVALNDDGKLTKLFHALDKDDTLLTAAVKHDLVMAVERMLRLGVDINHEYNKAPIELACIHGHWRSLELLLKSPTINICSTKKPLHTIVVKNIVKHSTDKSNYKRCFQLLLQSKAACIDRQDPFGSSALHYAVNYNDSDVITELLKRGAYVGVKNILKQYAITNINPTILEQHLDSCITTNHQRPGEAEFEIIFDYKNLVRYSNDNCTSQMQPIHFMSESNDLKHLLKHPLILSFLFLKWHRIAFIFYLNLFICALFSGITITYILLCYEGIFNVELRVISFCLLLCIILREFIQFKMSPFEYFRNWENYLELLLIILTLIVLANDEKAFNECLPKAIASATILLIAFELFILAGSLPLWSFSTHYEMLVTVTKTYLKSLCLYAIILLAFSLSFFILLQPTNQEETNGGNNKSNFNNFGNIGFSIMKTLVMSTGEIDAANIQFDQNSWSYIIFLIFVFLIPTVLSNLLNGLAVSDTHAIKSVAELTNLIYRTQILTRYERIPLLLGLNTSVSHLKIRVKPNNDNRIKVESDITEDETIEWFSSKGFLQRGSGLRMRRRVVKLAFDVLKKKERAELEELEKKRLINIENSLDRIIKEMTKENLEKLCK